MYVISILICPFIVYFWNVLRQSLIFISHDSLVYFFGTNSLGTARIKFSAHIICNINTKDLTVITDKINQFNKFKWNNKFLAKLTLIHQIVRVNYIRYLVLLHYTLNFYIGKNMCNIILQLLQYN